MKIQNLLEGSSYIDDVTNWLWSEWGIENNFNYWHSWVKSSLLVDKIPQTFIAIEDDFVIGTVSLWRCDLQSRQDIFPWLGGLYVEENNRRKGIGIALQEYAFIAAKNLGFTELYMFTELDNYFERFGWLYLEDIPNENGIMVKLYRKDL